MESDQNHYSSFPETEPGQQGSLFPHEDGVTDTGMTPEELQKLTERIGQNAKLTDTTYRSRERQPSEAAIDQGWGNAQKVPASESPPDWKITNPERQAAIQGLRAARAALEKARGGDQSEINGESNANNGGS